MQTDVVNKEQWCADDVIRVNRSTSFNSNIFLSSPRKSFVFASFCHFVLSHFRIRVKCKNDVSRMTATSLFFLFYFNEKNDGNDEVDR